MKSNSLCNFSKPRVCNFSKSRNICSLNQYVNTHVKFKYPFSDSQFLCQFECRIGENTKGGKKNDKESNDCVSERGFGTESQNKNL